MIDFAKELNAEQLKVVQEGDGQCLVLAGAGSGKTRTITYRVAYLLSKGVSPNEILLLTFTNKAAREMLNRVAFLVSKQQSTHYSLLTTHSQMLGGTFHSVAARLLRQYATLLGFQPNFSILDADDSKGLINLCLREQGFNTKSRRAPSPGAVQGIFSFSQNAEIPISEALEMKYPQFVPHADQFDAVFAQYARKKKAANVMDFDDLLILFALLLRNHADIRKKLSENFRHILVDEYQDTNRVQAGLVAMLAQAHRNLLVVGDDAQSIYSFRAADINNILEFEKTFPGAKVFRLTTNYRSTPEIITLANDVIRHNRHQYKKKLKSVIPSERRPLRVACASSLEEAIAIAGEITSLRAKGERLNSIAALFRAAYHSQLLEMELMKQGIPYDYRGGLRFFERKHVKDVLAFLRIAHNVKDEVAWMRILPLQAGIGEVGAKDIITLIRGAGELNVVLTIVFPETLIRRVGEGWKNAQKVCSALCRMKDESTGEMIRTIVREWYASFLESEFPDFRERLDDIEQLAVSADHARDLGAFLTEASLSENYSRERSARDGFEPRVVLSTVHQAKGLEWDTVFVINLTDGAFPNERAKGEEGGLEEERRLFYVAVTRARRRLILTYPLLQERSRGLASSPSCFLEEVDADLFEPEFKEDAIRYVPDDLQQRPRKKGEFLSSVDVF